MNDIVCKVKIDRGSNLYDITSFYPMDLYKIIKFIESTTKFEFREEIKNSEHIMLALLSCSEELEKNGIFITFEVYKPASDKEKVLEILKDCDDTISLDSIISIFLVKHYKDFSANRIKYIMKILDVHLSEKINELERIKSIAKERATYLKCYLEGEMYSSKETAEKHVNVQIENAKAIIDACDYKEEE